MERDIVIVLPVGNYGIKSAYLGEASIVGMSDKVELGDVIKLAAIRTSDDNVTNLPKLHILEQYDPTITT